MFLTLLGSCRRLEPTTREGPWVGRLNVFYYHLIPLSFEAKLSQRESVGECVFATRRRPSRTLLGVFSGTKCGMEINWRVYCVGA